MQRSIMPSRRSCNSNSLSKRSGVTTSAKAANRAWCAVHIYPGNSRRKENSSWPEGSRSRRSCSATMTRCRPSTRSPSWRDRRCCPRCRPRRRSPRYLPPSWGRTASRSRPDRRPQIRRYRLGLPLRARRSRRRSDLSRPSDPSRHRLPAEVAAGPGENRYRRRHAAVRKKVQNLCKNPAPGTSSPGKSRKKRAF
jgi:hypothetical protein